jgi:hypothetical protein
MSGPAHKVVLEQGCSDLAQIGAGDVGPGSQRVEDHARTPDERGPTARAQRAGDVPGVGRHEAQLPDVGAELVGGHAVCLGGRLQPPRRIGRQHPLEEWRQASVIELRLDHRLRRICQRGKSEATLPQPLQGTADLRVRWQPLHRSEDHCCVRLGQLAPAPLGDHRQCRPPDRAEVCVLVGDSGDQRGLQQLLEPFAADRRVAEDLAERVIEGAEIKERFVDVEDEDDRTRCHRLQAYRSPTATAARPGCLAGRRPTRTRMGNRPREARARCPPARRTWHGPGKSRSIRSRRPAPAQPRLRT